MPQASFTSYCHNYNTTRLQNPVVNECTVRLFRVNSGNDSDVLVPSVPCCGSQPADSPLSLMDRLGTKTQMFPI